MVRGFMVGQVTITVMGSALWIASIHIDYPNRLAPVSNTLAILAFPPLRMVYWSCYREKTTLVAVDIDLLF